MPPLARRNLFHDKVRLTVTLTGIVFAIVLIVVQLGLFLGFTSTTSGLIDKSGADLWIGSKNIPYLEQGVAFSERRVYTVLATPGVAKAEKFIARWSQWKRPDGRQEGALIIGFQPYGTMGRPWNVVSGNVEDLQTSDTVMVDELYLKKLGVAKIGDMAEINGHRARVAGFTRGIRSFTTSPYIFTEFKNAQNYARFNEDQTNFILVKAEPGTDLQALKKLLKTKLTDTDVYTAAEFSRMTQIYWMFTTGAGVAVLLAAALGLIVGFVVVAQTIYATTVDHMREFGTLKAMGASNGYIYKIIMQQALMAATIGYALGIVAALFVVRGSERGGAAILLPPSLAIGLFFLTVLMCISAAMVSINKVTRIDPAMVFKG
ncbi:MAG: FtsX-like permease family protein [Acidobacteria bacterium]|nr:FtsX-like permease family protein [Acidobacteriota bacterium]